MDFIDCADGFDVVENIHRDDKIKRNRERTLGPERGDIEAGRWGLPPLHAPTFVEG